MFGVVVGNRKIRQLTATHNTTTTTATTTTNSTCSVDCDQPPALNARRRSETVTVPSPSLSSAAIRLRRPTTWCGAAARAISTIARFFSAGVVLVVVVCDFD
jgi:hypothetical protein